MTEQDIKDWTDDAEGGYDVDRLKKRGRKPLRDGPAQVVPVRLDEALLAAVGRTGRARSHESLGGDPSGNPHLRRAKVHDSATKHGLTPTTPSMPPRCQDLDLLD